MCIYNILYAGKRMASVNRKIAKFYTKNIALGKRKFHTVSCLYMRYISLSRLFFTSNYFIFFLLFVKLYTITCCIVVFALCEWFMWKHFTFFFFIYKIGKHTRIHITMQNYMQTDTKKSQLYYSSSITTTTIERI